MAVPTELNLLDVVAGSGMLGLAVHVGCEALGYQCRTVGYIEREAYAATALMARMEDATLDSAPIWDDLTTFDGAAWRGCVDIIAAGLPCQPYSAAGKKLGNDDPRSHGNGDGPVPHFLRIVDEVRPALVFCENVSRWVVGGYFQRFGEELCRMGYDIEDPFFLSASDIGASHKRERVFVMAHAGSVGRWTQGNSGLTPAGPDRCCGELPAFAYGPTDARLPGVLQDNPSLKPTLCRMDDGMAARMERLRLIGNGVVPLQAATAFAVLLNGLSCNPT